MAVNNQEPHPMAPTVEQQYEQQVAAEKRDEARLVLLDGRLARLRVAVFLVLLGTVIAALNSDWREGWFAIAGVVFAAFVAIVSWHDYIDRLTAEARLKRRLCQQGIARIRRCWDDLPRWEVAVPSEFQATAHDLDLFGAASLFQLVSPGGTPLGRSVLRDWISQPASAATVESRQQAVAELAAAAATCASLQRLGTQVVSRQTGPSEFIRWAEGPAWLRARPWLLWAGRATSAVAIGAFAGLALGLLPPLAAGLTLCSVLAVNAGLSVLYTGSIHDIFSTVSTRNGEAAKYLEMFQLACEFPSQAELLRQLQADLQNERGGVLVRLRQLRRIIVLAAISRSPLLSPLVYLPLQLLCLWDVHVLWRLEFWQLDNARAVRIWFDGLARFEALCGLATLARENPRWVYPRVTPEAVAIRGVQLGHPLLADPQRVGNDVTVGPAGTFLLVTGSNMSGKSTLLRSIGTNVVLARIGAPVCAESLTLPPLEIATSMRLHDSLADGVSFFMAELKRLKEIVDLAHAFAPRRDFGLLYLLDEVLQGTNSRERQIAVSRVVRHLLDCRAMGAISTHDVELAAADSLSEACHPVHFRERLDAESPAGMTFDYRMRDGTASTTNALKLLELVGLRSS